MWRYISGGLAALLLVAAGVILFNGRARPSSPLAAQPPREAQSNEAGASLPDTVPEAGDKTREQKRFDRYDKDRNDAVTREEYLTPRRKAFAKLDVNHDGQLSFDEWATKTTAKFTAADADKSGTMTRAEFAKTAPKRRFKTRPNCTTNAAAAPREEES